MKKIICKVLIVISMLIFAGCSNSNVDLVRDGTLANYNKTTIGKAFEAAFDDTDWGFAESKKGEKIVTFTGKISKDLHESVIREIQTKPIDLNVVNDGYIYFNEMVRQRMFLIIPRVGGEDAAIFKELNEKYDCSFSPSPYVRCKDDKIFAEYNKDLMDFYIDKVWEVGAKVEFQWIVLPDGKNFQVSKVISDAWNNESVSNIFEKIYE